MLSLVLLVNIVSLSAASAGLYLAFYADADNPRRDFVLYGSIAVIVLSAAFTLVMWLMNDQPSEDNDAP